MQRIDQQLPSQSPGNQRTLSSWHFGQKGARPCVYIQAGLHADELPGVLVAHRLLQELEVLEAAGQIRGEIVVVPAANPIGMSQTCMGQHQGRFEISSGRNFNRGFPDLVASAAAQLQGRLTQDAQQNQALVRAALRTALLETAAASELDAMQKILFGLALEADVVIDLHCDSEAALHLYAHSEQLEQATVLGAYLGAQATLHAKEQGGQSFDDACTRQWWLLRRQFSAYPIPMACFAVTLELRGQADVAQALAESDADGLFEFLRWRGALAGAVRQPIALAYPATPLNCVEVLAAPHSGVVLYHGAVGRLVEAGAALAEILDPLSGAVYTLRASQPGMYYARVVHRYAQSGAELCFIAGTTIQRSGHLLSA